MSSLFKQITTIHRSDPTLSADDIASALDISPETVRMAICAPSIEDIPALLTVSKTIAFDEDAPARTRQAAVEFLVDELKGRNDAKMRHLNANSELAVRMIATLETAQNAVPDSIKMRRLTQVKPIDA